jgi:hypothetical protein
VDLLRAVGLILPTFLASTTAVLHIKSVSDDVSLRVCHLQVI